jgi:hypothetical protein
MSQKTEVLFSLSKMAIGKVALKRLVFKKE